MTSLPDELLLPDAAAWRAWLDEHEDDVPAGVWLVLAKKNRPAPTTLAYAEALDEALCSGWIDGRKRRRDDDTSIQHFCPRRPRSVWSQRNTEHVERLTAAGRMRPRGQAEVDRARADGRWAAAYEGSATMEMPEELTAALAASPRATIAWANLTAQNRFAILFRISGAKRAETRERNAARFVEMLENGQTPHPQRRALDGS
jgi:uncharacterized protein YdeI (YjbR/CyaY-like superfamily)